MPTFKDNFKRSNMNRPDIRTAANSHEIKEYFDDLEQQTKELKAKLKKCETKLVCYAHNTHLTFDDNLKDYFCYKCEAN